MQTQTQTQNSHFLKNTEIIAELNLYHPNVNFNELSDCELTEFFNNHLEKYSQEISVGELIKKGENFIFIDTPDGFQAIGDFYFKKPRTIYQIETHKHLKCKVSNDHLFETKRGWVKAENIAITDKILTREGFLGIHFIRKLGIEYVYDWEVLHENHRYWAGDGLSSHNTGKTFLALNGCREAQAMGYNIIYMDSEASIDVTTVQKFGIDPTKFRYQPVGTVLETRHFISNLITTLNDIKSKGKTPPKVMLVLDSLGNLATDKERQDSVDGSDKKDMTKQQQLRSLFRVITVDLAAVKVPLIICNHVYQGMGMFATKEMSGGGGAIYNCSIIIFLTKAKLKETGEDVEGAKDAEMGQTGIIVSSWPKKNRFAKPIPVKFHISFFKGMNKYTGLETYISWENCEIGRGKLITSKEYEKMKPAEKIDIDVKTMSWQKNGETFYYLPKDRARSYVVKHLNREVQLKELFTSTVITQDVLDMLDERIIKPTFMLPNINSLNEIEDIDDSIFETTEDGLQASEGYEEDI